MIKRTSKPEAKYVRRERGDGKLRGDYQDSDSITQSELMRMMNDNSKDEEVQADNYSSYISTESVHRPRHAQDMWSLCVN